MGKYADSEWYKRRLDAYTAQHGEVPPPWIVSPHSHPSSIRWRMGEGETLVMVFFEWWEQQGWSEIERVKYFQKWPPPPRWIPWMVNAIWNHPWETGFDYKSYYARINQHGFLGVEDIHDDTCDRKWLAMESPQS